MHIVKSVAAMQRLARRWKREGIAVGLVPTMGYLHAGHLSLVERARCVVGGKGKVVVSIYVNPTQFGPHEDLARYPRDMPRDSRLCRQAGVDIVFAPTDQQMYPGDSAHSYSTYVVEEALSKPLEGVRRPTHFRGVTTVVAKLFHIVQPDVAIFGAKDFQQAAVLQKMVKDLNFPLKLIISPTIREADGLAMSSRNKYLSAAERAQAAALYGAIQRACERVRDHRGGVAASRLRRELAHAIQQRPAARLDYLEFFEPDTLVPVKMVKRGTRMALAVFVGRTRLIDNAELR